MANKRRTKRNQKKQRRSPFETHHDELVITTLRAQGKPGGLPDETEVEAFITTLKESFADQTQAFQEHLRNFEPLRLLSTLSFYSLFGSSELRKRAESLLPADQFQIELVQAFILRREQSAYPWFPVVPDFTELLTSLDQASNLFWLKRLELPDSDEVQAQRSLLEDLRLHTQAVRNWSYPDQLERTIQELFSPFDDRAEEFIGIPPTKLFRLWLRIIQTVEERSRTHIAPLLKIARAKTGGHIFQQTGSGSMPDEMASATAQVVERLFPNITVEQSKSMAIQYHNLDIPSLHTFTLDGLCELYGEPVAADVMKSVMDSLAFRFGDLKEVNTEHLFLGNPIWQKPCILLEEGSYFIPLPTLFLGFGLEIMEALVAQHEPLREPYFTRRGRFLEDSLATLLQNALPGSKCFIGSEGHDPVEFENDLLVLLDHVAIIVEAKAGGVDPALRRGGTKSLRTTIDDLLVYPSIQGTRFQRILEENPGIHSFTSKAGGTNRFDNSNVKQYIRLSINLHSMGSVYGGWQRLGKAGFVPENVEPTPTMSLADLQSVLEILEGPCQTLHYLSRRADLERNWHYEGDELDLLALYLSSGFNIGEREFESGVLRLQGLGRSFDKYFMRHESGQNVKKPKLKIGKWWKELLTFTERRRPPGWTRLGIALLMIPFPDQVRFEREFSATKQVVQKFWKNDGIVDLRFMDTGPSQRMLALAGRAYRNAMTRDYELRVLDPIEQVFSSVKADKLLFIGVNVESDSAPWNDLCLANRPDRTAGDTD